MTTTSTPSRMMANPPTHFGEFKQFNHKGTEVLILREDDPVINYAIRVHVSPHTQQARLYSSNDWDSVSFLSPHVTQNGTLLRGHKIPHELLGKITPDKDLFIKDVSHYAEAVAMVPDNEKESFKAAVKQAIERFNKTG
jgi:hypothetical protein